MRFQSSEDGDDPGDDVMSEAEMMAARQMRRRASLIDEDG